MLFEPLNNPAAANLRFFDDFSTEPLTQAVTILSKDNAGVATVKGATDFVIDLTKATGYMQQQLPASKEYYSEGRHYNQFEIEGYGNADQVKLYQFLLEGFLPTEGGG